MLRKCIRAENMKLRHSLIWLACIIIPIIPAIIGTMNYQNNLRLLNSQWYSLWTQITLFYSSMFYAPLIGLYCSYLWRLEHLNNNWNVLMTAPVPVRNVFLAKLAVIFRVTLLTQALARRTVFPVRKILPPPRHDPDGNSHLAAEGDPGRRSRGDVAAFIVHGHPQLRRSHRPCGGRRHYRVYRQQQGMEHVLALFRDAAWHEFQQVRGFPPAGPDPVFCKPFRILSGVHRKQHLVSEA